MKFLDLFAGIGGARLGLEQAGMKCVGHVEWDKFARQSYRAIHSYGREEEYGKEFEGHDISKVKASELPRADLWVFGAPCQDFSFAGKRQGLAGDRSSLVGEVFRLIRETEERDRPEWLVYENVKGMLSSNGGRDFLQILISFDELGYDCEWQILNTKACGNAPPQNRERVYTIGHLRSRGRRKVFPVSGANSEANIKVVGTIRPHRHSDGDVHGVDGISPTLTSRDHKDPRLIAIKQVGQLYDSNSFGGNPQPGRIYDAEGLSPTLNTCSGGNRMPKIIDPRQTRADEDLRITYFCPTSTSIDCKRPKPITIIDDTYGYEGEPRVYESEAPTLRSSGGRLKVAFVNQPKYGEYKLGEVTDTLTSTGKSSRQHVFIGASRGRNPENPSDRTTGSPTEQRLEVNQNGTSNTLTSVQKDNLLITDYRIRKLTPKECWRLQGFPDYCIERAIRVGVSDSQLYKQAGNAISVNVAYVVGKAIMNEMKNDAGEY